MRSLLVSLLLSALLAPATSAQEPPAARADEAATLKRIEDLLAATKYAEAEDAAKKAAADFKDSAKVRCLAARLDIARGRYETALEGLTAASKLDFKLLEARSLRAELLDLLGRHDEATKAADAVIEFYNANAKDVTAPRELVAVGLALKLVNAPKDALRVFTLAQRADKADLIPTIELGSLFLLKGQVTDASREFNTVLAASPKQPDALLGLAHCAAQVGKLDDAETHAKAALEAAPNSTDALDLLAGLDFIDDDYAAAESLAAKSLAVNPNDLDAHAVLAGCCLVRGNDQAYKNQEAAVAKVNPHCSDFYTAVGNACENKKRMSLAEQMYRKAIELNPDACEALAALGQHVFRQAKYDEAKKLLEASHKIDGFNVRTYNTLNLLDEMEKYREYKDAAGASVRLKAELDGVLAPYVERYTARTIDELARIYGSKPAVPLTVEVMATQRYFAARCIGLPQIGATGVCFGNVVAFASPREQAGRINWRETLHHELTHAVTLLATDYRIPHWLTEAMAVHEQQSERPQQWDVLLKTSARLGRLIPVRDLSKGFTRPKTGEQRMLAYCQSGVVLDFIISKAGAKCLPALVAQFHDGKELPDALRAVTGLAFDEFERQCMAYVRGVADSLPVLPVITPNDHKAVLDAAAQKPDDPDAQCNLAILFLSQRKSAEAIAACDKALKARPKCAEACYLKAVALASGGKQEADAVAAARTAVAADKNYAPAYFWLAQLIQKKGNTEEAIALYRETIRSAPNFRAAYDALAKLYKDLKQDARAAEVFEELLRHTGDSFAESVELARYYVEQKKWADAARVADLAIGIGPFFGEPHAHAGHALWELGKEDEAVVEMQNATVCAGDTLKQMEQLYRQLMATGRKDQAADVQKNLEKGRRLIADNNVRLARACLKKGQKDLAKTAALAALELDPNSEEAQAILRQLGGG